MRQLSAEGVELSGWRYDGENPHKIYCKCGRTFDTEEAAFKHLFVENRQFSSDHMKDYFLDDIVHCIRTVQIMKWFDL